MILAGYTPSHVASAFFVDILATGQPVLLEPFLRKEVSTIFEVAPPGGAAIPMVRTGFAREASYNGTP